MNEIEKLLSKKKYIIFGTGKAAELLINLIEDKSKVIYCVDNNSEKWGKKFLDIPVKAPSNLVNEDHSSHIVLIASMYYKEISEQLIQMGLKENENFINGLILSSYLSKEHCDKKIIYPEIVNFPITNKCNFRCAMCNVWKPEYSLKKDMSPHEIFQVFNKPLFKEVKHVGLSGGEPFVRKDIFDVICSIHNALPSLKSISIITNGSLNGIDEKILSIKKYLDSKNINFTIQISIDGIGEIHDKNRGREGAFSKTYNNFLKLHSLGLVNEISTTITKNNYRYLWDMYRFAKEHNVYIRFRLASLIDRLYNHDLEQNFTFTKYEKLIIIKFLENIINYYEKDFSKQMFYRSLINQLLEGDRLAGCDYQTSKGVSLDPYGNLHFCFPKSKSVGNINNNDSTELSILMENQHILEETLAHCKNCTHDYTGSLTPKLVENYFNRIFQLNENVNLNTELLQSTPVIEYMSSGKKVVNKVLIIGWYGTETLGDKAILANIINNLVKQGFDINDISVASLNPFYTELTMIELGMEGIKVLDVYKVKNDFNFLNTQDLYIFGGGPLCDVEPLIDMVNIFKNAKKIGKRTVLYSCGIGPLSEERYIKGVDLLLFYTDIIGFRDRISIEKYLNKLSYFSNKNNLDYFIDPATGYIVDNLENVKQSYFLNEDYVLFCLREWPKMYAEGLNEQEYNANKKMFEEKMISLINQVSKMGKKIVLFPMHTFFVGDDDREYYLNLMSKINLKNCVIFSRDYTPEEAISLFKYASFTVGMRFHSVVFSISCNTPCLAIDYHYGQGKISGFMNELNLSDYTVDFKDFINSDIFELIKRSESMHDKWNDVNKIIIEKNILMDKYYYFK